jgi:hypothetical protein
MVEFVNITRVIIMDFNVWKIRVDSERY